ncbi:MAG: hypothetical protein BRD50_04785 [Bacteroidetes bacterium SW_11_45_7]|nr:MAG: hypothetical protein BRD50_04785 [Bacteroidetes bacterium SW_11_45_7]
MKRLTLLIVFIIALSCQSFGQRFAYVNTEYVLEQIPEYQQAQKKLDKIAKDWREEIEKRKKKIEELYKDYQAEQVLMTEEMKRKREQEITQKEQALEDFRQQKFGYKGDLHQKRKELIEPIQNKVYNNVQKIAKNNNYDFIFDKSNGVNMLYANDRYDVSDDVINAMGYTPGKNKNESDNKK